MRRLRLASAICLSLSLALAACQSTPAEVLDIAAPAVETVGSGAVDVAMLLPRSAAGDLGVRARDMRDGAGLAVDELGGGRVALTVYDIAPPGTNAGDVALQAVGTGAKVIVGPVTAEATAAVAAIPEANRPPILSFATNAAAQRKGVFAMVSDQVDSAIEGAHLMVALGKPDMLVFLPEAKQASEQRLRRGIEKHGGKLAGIARYGPSQAGVEAALAKHRSELAKAQAVIVLGEEAWPAALVRGIRASDAAKPDLAIVGTSAWPASIYSDATVDGAVIALADQDSLKQIAERYHARYGRPLSFDAAYGYDALATVSGIVRAMGPDALNGKTLTVKSGFRGATGVFRLHEDGTVERRLATYRIVAGKLKPFQPAAEGF